MIDIWSDNLVSSRCAARTELLVWQGIELPDRQ